MPRPPARSPSVLHPTGEWIGGRFTPPLFITDRDEPYRPSLAVWMELPERLIVGQTVVPPEEASGAVGHALRAALEHPMVGAPRRPKALRIADPALESEVRAVIGADVPVLVAPTPELDAMLDEMLAMMPREEAPSYFEDGRVQRALLEHLFRSACLLYDLAPWKVATDDQVFRLDIPALGVEGACVSIMGNLGEVFGLIIFPSLSAFDRFADVVEEAEREGTRPRFESDWISLSFERAADLPASMLGEVEAHDWPLAGPDAYPHVEHFDTDGASRPVVERDVRIAAACAASLVPFFLKHRDLFETDRFEPVCESWFDDDDLEVRFTVPYEGFSLFDVASEDMREAPVVGAQPKVGRNDPCPCGSGRKYKKCHLAADERAHLSATAEPASHDMDGRFVERLAKFAASRFGLEWQLIADEVLDAGPTLELVVPWSVYDAHVQGRPVVEWYLAERGRRLAPGERAWLEAQRRAWLSVWEVTAVQPGETLTLRDLITDETRTVRERTASHSLIVRDAILARVVDGAGASFLCGVHLHSLPPFAAAEVVRRARGRLRRKRAVPPERLGEEGFGRYLIRRWAEAVASAMEAAAVPPQLTNTDGDPMLLTTDHFEIAADARPEVEARLGRLENVNPPEPGDDPPAWVFIRPGSAVDPMRNTVIGRASIRQTRLQVETNSRVRADALRDRIETMCGELIRHRAREHTDPTSPKADRGQPPVAPTPEVAEALADVKRRYYAAWLDQPIPVLGGQTPREAARTAAGRDRLDVLLKEMENREHRAGDAFDFSTIRRELGLDVGPPEPPPRHRAHQG